MQRRQRVFKAILGLSMAGSAGCATNAGSGALIGGASGAGAGALIGSAGHEAAGGAIVGGAIGALTGAIIGNDIDRQQADRNRYYRGYDGPYDGPVYAPAYAPAYGPPPVAFYGPGPAVWVHGHWRYDFDHWVWIPGHWA